VNRNLKCVEVTKIGEDSGRLEANTLRQKKESTRRRGDEGNKDTKSLRRTSLNFEHDKLPW